MWKSLWRMAEPEIGGSATKRSRWGIGVWAGFVVVIGVILWLKGTTGWLPGTSGNVVLILFLSALICEFIDSALGMGYGTTLTPLLLLFGGFDPAAVVPAVLLSEALTGATAALFHHREGNINWRESAVRRTGILLCALSAVGAVAAVTLALSLPKFWHTLVIAVIVLSVGVLVLGTIRRRPAYRPAHLLVLGGIAAFNKGLSGGGYGPLVTAGQVVSGIGAKQAVAITSLAEAVTCVIGLCAYALAAKSIDWAIAVPLCLGALMSVPLATRTVALLPERLMRGSVGAMSMILGLVMLIKIF